MDYKKLDEVVSKLESKFIPESAKGNLEAKEILAITQAYRILRIKTEPKPRFKKLKQILFDAYCILDHPFTQIIILIVFVIFIVIHFTSGKL